MFKLIKWVSVLEKVKLPSAPGGRTSYCNPITPEARSTCIGRGLWMCGRHKRSGSLQRREESPAGADDSVVGLYVGFGLVSDSDWVDSGLSCRLAQS